VEDVRHPNLVVDRRHVIEREHQEMRRLASIMFSECPVIYSEAATFFWAGRPGGLNIPVERSPAICSESHPDPTKLTSETSE
jgi:hypothetical protein